MQATHVEMEDILKLLVTVHNPLLLVLSLIILLRNIYTNSALAVPAQTF